MEDDIIEKVSNDPSRQPEEKETGINFLGNEEQCTVFSAKRTVVKSLLDHDEFVFEWATVDSGEGSKRVNGIEGLEEANEIYSVSGSMPIGCVTVKSTPRSNNHQSSVVNSEKVDEGTFE